MKNRRKICFITGSRAEYGFLYWIMKSVQQDPELELQVMVVGSHVDRELGNTAHAIEQDGFQVNEKIKSLSPEDTRLGAAESLAEATKSLAAALERLRPDWAVLLGDRYEILAAAQACLILQIPVAHIAGGDTTEGAFDEAMRHSITKMSHLHFVTNDLSAERVRQMGENPDFVFNFGSPSLDALHRLQLLNREELEEKLDFKFQKKNLLVTFHPATLEAEPATDQIDELFRALDSLGEETGIIFTKSNADPEGRALGKKINGFASTRKNVRAFTSLGQLLYLSLMKHSSAVVGNSSSGLYEAPSFRIPTVNIGNRQKGRLRAESIIDCGTQAGSISRALEQAFQKDVSAGVNPYESRNSSERILRKIKEVKDPKALLQKHFFMVSRSPRPSRVQIIAEAGVNHNGSLETALQMVDCAAEAGADAVKFQTFRADDLVCRNAEKAEYQKKFTETGESQWAMLKKLELTEEMHLVLSDHCRKKGIEFLSTAFTPASVDLLAQKVGVARIKVPSGEITNAPLLLKIARTGLPVILSTGMATLKEVEEALAVLALGYTNASEKNPAKEAFQNALDSFEGKRILKEKVTLLHCTTEYPVPFSEVNLLAMDSLREKFQVLVGLSDHSPGYSVPVAAAARGAALIEKHFTLDKNLPGPDHTASLEPEELKAMVRSIREVEAALGSGIKAPAPSEMKNIPIARKSLVAKRAIRKGENFSEDNLTVKRPGNGMSPMLYWEMFGKPAQKEYKEDEVIA